MDAGRFPQSPRPRSARVYACGNPSPWPRVGVFLLLSADVGAIGLGGVMFRDAP